MSFALTVNLDVTGRRAVVIGGGYEAVDRARALTAAGAVVRVITPDPDPALTTLAAEGAVTLSHRCYRRGDLAGAFVAYVTREDATPVDETWAEANERGVLLSTLDDVPHCHFSTPSMVRRGDLGVAIATRGRAPALAKRLRRDLEATYGPELGELVEVLDEAKQACLPRQVPFAEWSARWAIALADLHGLLTDVADGPATAVRDRVIEVLSTPSDVALPCAVEPPCADTTPACVGRQADLCAPAAVADGPPRTEVLT